MIMAMLSKLKRKILLEFLMIIALLPFCYSLQTKRPIKRVAIIGAGISGLSLAHALTDSPQLSEKFGSLDLETVQLFDSRSGLDRNAGAGVQLNGGLAVLGKINPRLLRAVKDAGIPVVGVRSRCKPWNPDEDEYDTLLSLDLKETVQKAGSSASSSLIQNGELLWIAIMRGALQEVLYNTLPCRDQVRFKKTLVGIDPSEDGGVLCRFADNTTVGPFDLVVGCDGIKSAVREFQESSRISSDASKREGEATAIYSGLRIRYAVQGESPAESSTTLSQYFGDGAYALAGTYGNGKGKPNAKSAFLIYMDPDYTGPIKTKSTATVVRENADWSQDIQQSAETAKMSLLEQTRTLGVPQLDIAPIITSADRFFDLGVYFHNPFSIVGWTKAIPNTNGALTVLCGDAAHALPPFLGQGSNQGIQDAYCLASKIYEFNANIDDAELIALLRDYEKTRWPVAFEIFWKAAFLGYLETGGSNGLYAKFRDTFFKTMGLIGVAQRVLLKAAIPKV